MNPIDPLLSESLVHAIGWTLLHSLWQGALVALVLSLVLRLIRERAADARYLAALGALLMMALLPVLTFLWVWEPGASGGLEAGGGRGAALLLDPTAFTAGGAAGLEPGALWGRVVRHLEGLLPWITLAWVLGVVLMSLRLVVDWTRVLRLRRVGVRPLEGRWPDVLAQLRLQLRVSRPVHLVESALVQVPMAVGWLRPMILVPTGALLGLTPAQLEAVVAHELAHIRRHDYLVNLVQSVIDTLLFYHPAVWWVSQRVRIEREHCCDDLAVAVCGSVRTYARALAELEQLRAMPQQLAMGATGGTLLYRIRRLLNKPLPASDRSPRLIAGFIALTAAVTVGARARATWNPELEIHPPPDCPAGALSSLEGLPTGDPLPLSRMGDGLTALPAGLPALPAVPRALELHPRLALSGSFMGPAAQQVALRDRPLLEIDMGRLEPQPVGEEVLEPEAIDPDRAAGDEVVLEANSELGEQLGMELERQLERRFGPEFEAQLERAIEEGGGEDFGDRLGEALEAQIVGTLQDELARVLKGRAKDPGFLDRWANGLDAWADGLEVWAGDLEAWAERLERWADAKALDVTNQAIEGMARGRNGLEDPETARACYQDREAADAADSAGAAAGAGELEVERIESPALAGGGEVEALDEASRAALERDRMTVKVRVRPNLMVQVEVDPDPSVAPDVRVFEGADREGRAMPPVPPVPPVPPAPAAPPAPSVPPVLSVPPGPPSLPVTPDPEAWKELDRWIQATVARAMAEVERGRVELPDKEHETARERALERAERERERALEQAERARERAERERERALEQAERDRERALEQAERAREQGLRRQDRNLEGLERVAEAPRSDSLKSDFGRYEAKVRARLTQEVHQVIREELGSGGAGQEADRQVVGGLARQLVDGLNVEVRGDRIRIDNTPADIAERLRQLVMAHGLFDAEDATDRLETLTRRAGKRLSRLTLEVE